MMKERNFGRKWGVGSTKLVMTVENAALAINRVC